MVAKGELQKYCDLSYAISGIIQCVSYENSKEIYESVKAHARFEEGK